MKFWLALLTALACPFYFAVAGPSTGARPIHLFDNSGEPVLDYAEKLSSVEPGDELILADGRSFRIIGKLGAGNETRIFEVEVGKKRLALRIPINSPRSGIANQVKDFVAGYNELKGSRFPVVRLLDTDNRSYTLVEKLPIQFTLGQLLEKGVDLSQPDMASVRKPLLEFADKTADFASFGDFHTDNLGYVNGKWMLFDWTGSSRRVSDVGDSRTVFTAFQENAMEEIFAEALGKPLPPAIKKANQMERKLGAELSKRVQAVRIKQPTRTLYRCFMDGLRNLVLQKPEIVR